MLCRGPFPLRRGPLLAAVPAAYKLKPQTVYNTYVGEQRTPVAAFKTNPMGMANGTVIGPLREVVATLSSKQVAPSAIVVMDRDGAADPAKAVLVSSK